MFRRTRKMLDRIEVVLSLPEQMNKFRAALFSRSVFDWVVRPIFFVLGFGLLFSQTLDDEWFIAAQQHYFGGLLFAVAALVLIAAFLIPFCVRKAPNMRGRGWGVVWYPAMAWAWWSVVFVVVHHFNVGDWIGYVLCAAAILLSGLVGMAFSMLSIVFPPKSEKNLAARLDGMRTKYAR